MAKKFYLVIAAQAFALTGGYIQTLALSWAVSAEGGGLFRLAGYLLACYLPVALLSYPFGRFLDRRALKPWLLGSELALAALSLLLWQVARRGAPSYLFLLGFGAVWGLVRAVQTPIYQSLPRRLCGALSKATAQLAAIGYLARGLGPILGGLIFARWGAAAPYFANFCSFLPSILLLSFLKIPRKEGAPPPKLRPLVAPLLRIFTVGFFGTHYNLTLVALVRQGGKETAAYGITLGLLGLGALAGFWSKKKLRLPAEAAILGMGALNLALAFLSGIWLQGACFLLYGFFDFWYFSQSALLLSSRAEEGQATAVMGLYTVATIGAPPLGALLWSACIGALGLRPTLAVIGGGLLLFFFSIIMQRMERNETSIGTV